MAQTGRITGEPGDGARVLYPLTGETAAALENSGSSAETPGENNPGADSSPTVKRNDQRMLLLMTGLGPCRWPPWAAVCCISKKRGTNK